MSLEHQDFYLMGDFNAVMDRQLDRSTFTGKKKGGLLRKAFMEMAEELLMLDCWRTQYLNKRKFTSLIITTLGLD